MRNRGQRGDCFWPWWGNTRTDSHLTEVSWGIPSSWPGWALPWSRPSHLEQTGLPPVTANSYESYHVNNDEFMKIYQAIRIKFILLLTIPEERTLLRYSRKASSLISWSVKMNVIPFPWAPAVRYRYLRSSRRLDTL